MYLSSPELGLSPSLSVQLKSPFLSAALREGRIRFQEIKVHFISLGTKLKTKHLMHMYYLIKSVNPGSLTICVIFRQVHPVSACLSVLIYRQD